MGARGNGQHRVPGLERGRELVPAGVCGGDAAVGQHGAAAAVFGGGDEGAGRGGAPGSVRGSIWGSCPAAEPGLGGIDAADAADDVGDGRGGEGGGGVRAGCPGDGGDVPGAGEATAGAPGGAECA